MSTGARVVPLNAGTGTRAAAGEHSVPAGLQPLREAAQVFLRAGLQRVFDAADDSLFAMCERVASNVEQEELFAAMRTLRLRREGIESSLRNGLDKAFREIAADSHQLVMDVLPASMLTLVSHDELEETVAVKTMVMRSLSDTVSELNALQQRLQALVGRPVTEDNNPLSARTLCQLMLAALRPLELKIQGRLLLLKLFEKHLLKDLGELYAAANDQLIAAGVLPNLPQQKPRAPRAAVRERVAAQVRPPAEEPVVALSELRELLGQVHGGTPPPADAVPISQDDLTRLLSLVQRQLSPAGNPMALRQQLDTLLARASAKSPRPRVIGRLEEEMITLVSMLFKQVLGDAEVPEPLRGPIGAMQVPLLKAAILDQGVFAEQDHPARQLLNEVTLAARDSEGLADLQRDRLHSKIEQVSARLREEFTDDPGVFASLLEDFSRFTASEQRRAALLEQRLLEAEEARALRENARQQVDRLLSERLQGLTLPAAIVQGLERGWGALLQLIFLREGSDSAAWEEALLTLDQLLAHVSPPAGQDAADLAEGARDALFAALGKGLEQVAYDPFEQQRFFSALEAWREQLAGQAPAGVPAALPAATEDPASQVAVVEHSPLPGPVAPPVPASAPVVPSAEPAASAPAESRDAEQFPTWERAPLERLEESSDFVLLEAVPPADAIAAAPSVATDESSELAEPTEPSALLEASPQVAEVGVLIEEAHWALVDGLGAGSWVEFCAEDGARQRCKLAAFIRLNGQYIFVNRAGVKVVTHERESLAQAFASGQAQLMSNAQPFDRALQAIIGNLREMREA